VSVGACREMRSSHTGLLDREGGCCGCCGWGCWGWDWDGRVCETDRGGRDGSVEVDALSGPDLPTLDEGRVR
jgi:hypothetical protein